MSRVWQPLAAYDQRLAALESRRAMTVRRFYTSNGLTTTFDYAGGEIWLVQGGEVYSSVTGLVTCSTRVNGEPAAANTAIAFSSGYATAPPGYPTALSLTTSNDIRFYLNSGLNTISSYSLYAATGWSIEGIILTWPV